MMTALMKPPASKPDSDDSDTPSPPPFKSTYIQTPKFFEPRLNINLL